MKKKDICTVKDLMIELAEECEGADWIEIVSLTSCRGVSWEARKHYFVKNKTIDSGLQDTPEAALNILKEVITL